MNKKVFNSICLGLCILCFILCFFLRTIPSSRVWKNAQILIVPLEYDNNALTKIVENHKINCLSLSNVKSSMPDNFFMHPINFNYIEDCKNYFFDKSKNYQILYLINPIEENISNLCKTLNYEKIKFSIDAKVSFPYLASLLCTFFIIALCFFVDKDRFSFFIVLFPLIFFSWCSPFWTQSISICMISFAYFSIFHQRKRNKFLLSVLNNPVVMLLTIVYTVINILSGFKIFLLFFCSTFSSLIIFYLSENISLKKILNKHSFEPIMISNAKKKIIPNFSSLMILVVATFVFFLGIVFTNSAQVFSNSEDKIPLSIPSPVGYTVKGKITTNDFEKNFNLTKSKDFLPDLFDYISNVWINITFPYKSLFYNTDSEYYPKKDQVVVFPDYEMTDNIMIKKENNLFVFNDDFINDSLLIINGKYDTIESVLMGQNGLCKVAYSKYSNNANQGSVMIKLIVMLCITLGILGYLIVLWRKNGK